MTPYSTAYNWLIDKFLESYIQKIHATDRSILFWKMRTLASLHWLLRLKKIFLSQKILNDFFLNQCKLGEKKDVFKQGKREKEGACYIKKNFLAQIKSILYKFQYNENL